MEQKNRVADITTDTARAVIDYAEDRSKLDIYRIEEIEALAEVLTAEKR